MFAVMPLLRKQKIKILWRTPPSKILDWWCGRNGLVLSSWWTVWIDNPESKSMLSVKPKGSRRNGLRHVNRHVKRVSSRNKECSTINNTKTPRRRLSCWVIFNVTSFFAIRCSLRRFVSKLQIPINWSITLVIDSFFWPCVRVRSASCYCGIVSVSWYDPFNQGYRYIKKGIY